MRQVLLGLGWATAALAAGCGGAGGVRPGVPERAAAAAAELRAQFFRHDYEGAYFRGRDLAARFPASGEVRAWWIAATAANGMVEDALAAADSLDRARPGDGWSDLARGVVLSRQVDRTAEAVTLARRARAAVPADRAFAWVLAEALYRDGDYDDVIALADSVFGRPPAPGALGAELLALRGRAEETAAWTSKRDTSAYTRALASARAALALDSSSYEAEALRADCLDARADTAAARAATRRLVALAPLSADAHRALWDAVQSQEGLSPDEKRAAIVPDVDSLLRARPAYPGVLLAAANVFRALDLPARRDSVEGHLLADYPDSYEAERLLIDRIRRFGSPLAGKQPDASVRAEMRRQLAAFIARPVHRSRGALGEAYTTLFALVPKDSTSADELARLAEGMRRYDVINPYIVNTAPFVLADRGVALELAEGLAREIPRRSEARRALLKHALAADVYARQQAEDEAQMRDALGWIFVRRGTLDSAHVELSGALALRPKSASVRLHMGRLHEAEGELPAAEASYLAGFLAERRGVEPGQLRETWLGGHENEAALRALYLRLGRPAGAFGALVAQLDDSARAVRKSFTLAQRVTAKRQPLPPFALEALNGGMLTLESLRGRVVFVDFWGVWCGPCVAEMPEIQKLREHYRADPDVAVVTIDSGDQPQVVRDFMQRKGYDFPVLLDHDYAQKQANVRGWPTSFFLDREGRIGFYGTHVGRTLEDFVWVVEALRTEASASMAPTP